MTNLYLVLFDKKIKVIDFSIKNERSYVNQIFPGAMIYSKWILFDAATLPYLVEFYFL